MGFFFPYFRRIFTMTYLERITYLVGNFAQLTQYALKNAYRVVTLCDNSKRVNEFTKGDELLVLSENQAKKLCLDQFTMGSSELEVFFKDKGMSEANYRALVRILKKRDYVVNYFFIENSYALSREEVAVYESRIEELSSLCEECSKLIAKLCKESDKLYTLFQK